MLKFKSLIPYSFLLLAVVLIQSCGEPVHFIEKKDFENATWSFHDKVQFNLSVEDTSSLYDLLYLIRNDQDYPYYNLYLTYFLENSDGVELGKRLQEVHLMDARTGEPLGSGFGGVYDHKILALPNLKFQNPGKYRFSIMHYMRTDSLKGIISFGVQLNKKAGN